MPRKQRAGFDRCGYDAPMTSDVEVEQVGEVVVAEIEPTYGSPQVIDPFEAMLHEVARTAGHAAWLGRRLAQEPADALADRKSSASRWRDLYMQERRLLAQVSDRCVALGLADRQVQVAENQGRMIAELVLRVADRLGLTESQRQQLPMLLQVELDALQVATTPPEGPE